jgi:hypothetical protein
MSEHRTDRMCFCETCVAQRLADWWEEDVAEHPGFDADGNEICCWHGSINCAGCCVAGDCDLHKDAASAI